LRVSGIGSIRRAVPVVGVFLVGPILVVKFLLDGGIEFVTRIFLVLLTKAFEFGNRWFGRVV